MRGPLECVHVGLSRLNLRVRSLLTSTHPFSRVLERLPPPTRATHPTALVPLDGAPLCCRPLPILRHFTTISQRFYNDFTTILWVALSRTCPILSRVFFGSSPDIDGNRDPSKGCDGRSIPRRAAHVEVPTKRQDDDGAAQAPRARRGGWLGHGGSCRSGGERSEPQRV